MDISSALIERINNSIDLTDRKRISSDIIYLKSELESECEQLKKNFILNLPIEYNDEQKFDELCGEIDVLSVKLETLKEKNLQLNKLIEHYKQEKNDRKYSMLDSDLKPLILKLVSTEKSIDYVKSLIEINEISTQLDLKLASKLSESKQSLDKQVLYQQKENLSSQLIDLYEIILTKYNNLSETNFDNLKKYLHDLVIYYYEKLKILFVSEFKEALKSLGYPILSTEREPGTKDDRKNSGLENLRALLELFGNRLIQIEDKKIDKNQEKSHLVIETLSGPLKTRFQYHFYGIKKTNKIDKPEWYLTQIFQWLKDNDRFIVDTIQPIFSKHKSNINARNQFIKALIKIINEKFVYDFKRFLCNNDAQMAHTIDELFIFDRQLKLYFNYPNDEYNCMHILCDDKIFSHWIQLEYQMYFKKIDDMFQSDRHSEIWSCKFDDIDEYKTPNCTESFILLMKSISERYKQLPFSTKKLKFLKLQLEFFNDYHFRLCQIIRDENLSKNPLNKTNYGILNAINYVLYVLSEWENTPFYIELQFIKSSYLKFMNYQNIDESNKAEALFGFALGAELSKKFDTQIKTFSDSHMDLINYVDLDKSVFSEITQQFEIINEDMIKKIVSECRWQITSRSKNYRKEKWMSLPPFESFYKPNLSQSATEMFISLKNLLNSLHESLARNLFLNILKRITRELDIFFYEHVILENRFNDGGVSQLVFDVKRYLLPILNEYSNNFTIENYFLKTKEALVLLQLNEGSSILLHEVISKGLQADSNDNDQNMNSYNAKKALKEFGITQLKLKDAESVLSKRIFKLN